MGYLQQASHVTGKIIPTLSSQWASKFTGRASRPNVTTLSQANVQHMEALVTYIGSIGQAMTSSGQEKANRKFSKEVGGISLASILYVVEGGERIIWQEAELTIQLLDHAWSLHLAPFPLLLCLVPGRMTEGRTRSWVFRYQSQNSKSCTFTLLNSWGTHLCWSKWNRLKERILLQEYNGQATHLLMLITSLQCGSIKVSNFASFADTQ